MEFDPKCFFEHPPRMREDLKEHIKAFSHSVVVKMLQFGKIMFEQERLTDKHIVLILIAMCPEPLTIYNCQGLCVETSKLKPIYKVLCRSITTALDMSKEDTHGGIDKKLHKSCLKVIKENGVKTSQDGALAIGAVVSQVCGIILQSALHNAPDSKTLTLDIVREKGYYHKTSTGNTVPYPSLMRFANVVENFVPTTPIMQPEVKSKEHSTESKRVQIENDSRRVTFGKEKCKDKMTRPTTPDNCFWDD